MDENSSVRKILVVEDESIIAMDTINTLNRLGYKTLPPVDNGPDAIAAAEKLQPSLVLIDILLKGDIDGIEAAVVIQEQCNLPIVYLTANTDEQTFQRAKLSGPFGYLLKPFEERELHTTIETALYKHQMEQELHRYRDHLEELVQQRTAELEKTHAALQQSEENYRTIFANANDAIFVIGADTRILDANPKASELTGHCREEIQQLTMEEISAAEQPLSPEETRSILQKALAGEPQVFEWLAKHMGRNEPQKRHHRRQQYPLGRCPRHCTTQGVATPSDQGKRGGGKSKPAQKRVFCQYKPRNQNPDERRSRHG